MPGACQGLAQSPAAALEDLCTHVRGFASESLLAGFGFEDFKQKGGWGVLNIKTSGLSPFRSCP